MTRQWTSAPWAVGLRLRYVMSWAVSLAIALIALVACAQLESRANSMAPFAVTSVAALAPSPLLPDGCADHQPGGPEHCASALQHMGKALAPAPDMGEPWAKSSSIAAPSLSAPDLVSPPCTPSPVVDLHVLQVQRT